MWRRSWLSREVLLFSAFSAVAPLYAGMLWLEAPGSTLVGGLTVLLGIAGVTASACIYRVPSRPSWNTPYTLAQFGLTAALLGPLLAAAAGVGESRWLVLTAAAMAGTQFVVIALSFFRCIASDSLELKGTARLLSTVLARTFVLRGALLALGAIGVPLLAGPAAGFAADAMTAPGYPTFMVALALAVAGEIAGRYLFFVSAVPKHLAASYVAAASEAA
jgi:DMSO reductase anchor subunit